MKCNRRPMRKIRDQERTDEEIMDVIGNLVSGTSPIVVTYNDSGDELVISLNESAISITESQISDLTHYTTADFTTDYTSELANDHTWTGENTFSDDVTHEAEVKGTRFVMQFSLSSWDLSGAGVKTAYLKWGEVLLSAAKGAVMPRNGSVTDVSIMYDVDANSGGSVALYLRPQKNGADIVNMLLNSAVATEKTDTFTQARDVDVFSAGDDIQVRSFFAYRKKFKALNETRFFTQNKVDLGRGLFACKKSVYFITDLYFSYI